MQRMTKKELYDLIEHCKSMAANNFILCESKYEHWMCNFVIEFAKRTGALKVQLAAALGISWSTFCKWRQQTSKLYKQEFADAVELAETYAKALLVDIAHEQLESPKEFFNALLYQMLGRYAGEFTEHRMTKIRGLDANASYEDQIKSIINAIREGEINSSEAKNLADAISKLAKVEEVTELKNSLLELKSQVKQISLGNNSAE